jgi:hypothetical protein
LLLLVAVCLLIGYSLYRNRQKARRF